MKKYDGEYQEVLTRLTNAKPSEVGKILKEYFNLKKKRSKK